MDEKELELELNLASVQAIIEGTKEERSKYPIPLKVFQNVLTYWEGEEHKFQELLYQYRLEKEGNAGVSVRSPQEPSV